MSRTRRAICASSGLVMLILILQIGGQQRSQSNSSKALHSTVVEQLSPYEWQVRDQVRKLNDPAPSVRAAAAESLGYLRAYPASSALAEALADKMPEVRREAALALAWCGGKREVESLVRALDDNDWSVRQSATVALNNLTGMEFPFDALADAQTRQKQAAQWRGWWAGASKEIIPADVFALLNDKNPEVQLRGVRALGAIGGPESAPKIVHILNPLVATMRKAAGAQAQATLSPGRQFGVLTDTERALAQACIRSLGRLHAPESFAGLVALLETAHWARYAADALGDLGSTEAVAPMVAALPRFSPDLDDHEFKRKPPELCPPDDCPNYGTEDRMFETPYAIIQALSRLPLNKPQQQAEIRKIAYYLVANIPSDFDAGTIYEPEAHQLLTAYLLDKAGEDLRPAACDAAFRAANESEKWFGKRFMEERFRAERQRFRNAALGAVAEQSEERGGGELPRPDSARSEAPTKTLPPAEAFFRMATHSSGDVPYMAAWLPALCGVNTEVPRLMLLLDHENGWVRIGAIKGLIFANAKEAIDPIAKRLAASHSEADYGFSGVHEQETYNDPAPRSREALIRALGRLQAKNHDELLIRIMEDERSVQDIRYVAAQALDNLDTPKAIAALKRAEAGHPFYSVRLVAREALWRRGIRGAALKPMSTSSSAATADQSASSIPSYVFIQGDNKVRSDLNSEAGMDPWRETYTLNNPMPTIREGRNLYILTVDGDKKQIRRLTKFDGGFVADCEVSWDGTKIIFARRRSDEQSNYAIVTYSPPQLRTEEFQLDGKNDPWWHIWEINVDGTGLRQVTHGPYHDVQPAYLPDGRIIFASTRLGLRDEYHGYPATGLSVMNPDGSDIRVIGFNFGGDREPSVMPDGRIAFSRLDLFYSRLKTEMTLQFVNPDGTKNASLYGPERRPFWADVNKKHSFWSMLPSIYERDGGGDNRNRVLKLTQPQGLPDGRTVAVSGAGLVVVGPGATEERLVPHDRKFAVTSPFPIESGKKVVAAATIKQFKIGGKIIDAETPEMQAIREKTRYGYQFTDAVNVDLGLYKIDLESGEMTLLYNDPKFAEFEPRPIASRIPPQVLPEMTTPGEYTAHLIAASVFHSRIDRVRTQGKLIRVIEGQPFPTRHEFQTSVHANPGFRWKNHGGTFARVLGTVPLAADGSFNVEVPADRLLHLQVLDSDRRVVGNQTFWMYARPGEKRACVGCHEPRNISVSSQGDILALKASPLRALPEGGEFSYRAKTWFKGELPDELEERTRTARAVNLIGRQ